MDPTGTISEGEWSCLSGMYTSLEADFIAQLLGNYPMIGLPDSSSNNGASSGFYWPSNDPARGIELGPNGGPSYDSHELDGQELVHFFKPCPIMVTSDHGPMSMEFCVEDASNNVSYLAEGDENSIQENVEETNGDHHQLTNDLENDHDHHLQPEMELRIRVEEPPVVGDQGNGNGGNATPRNPKKRQRSTSLGDNARSDKIQKLASISSYTNEEENNASLSRPASGSCCSEDDPNGSHEPKGTQALKLSGKTRAGHGAATDPQSLYARKRRERINERLKILQSLVPNGTKVDISTMLEEAVQYVKFLQLQIKLLSSDEMWMYAPIAYNGMDIGLNLR